MFGVGGCLAFRIKQRNCEQSESVVQLIAHSAWLVQAVSWSISSLLYLKRLSLVFFHVEMDILAPGRDSSLLTSFMRSYWFWWQRLLFSFCLVIQVISSKMIQKSVAFQPLLNMDFLLLIYMLVLVEIWRLTQIFLRSECLMFAIELLTDVLYSGFTHWKKLLMYIFSWFLVFVSCCLWVRNTMWILQNSLESCWFLTVEISYHSWWKERKWDSFLSLSQCCWN